MRRSASCTARRYGTNPSGGSGTYCAMSCSRTSTSVISERTSGLASEDGTGVTSPTQWLDRPGVRNGTRTIRRFGRSAASANPCIMAR